MEFLLQDIGYVCTYVLFLDRVHSFCHFLKGLSVAHKILRTHGLEHAFSIGAASPRPQGVKNWFGAAGILDITMVCVPPRGP